MQIICTDSSISRERIKVSFRLRFQEAGRHERRCEGQTLEQEGIPKTEQRGGGQSAPQLLVRISRSRLRGWSKVADLLSAQKLEHRSGQTDAGSAQVVAS